MMNRVAKIVERKPQGIASSYKYPIWCMRVVICTPEQNGYLNEKGVELVWESANYTSKGQRPGCKYQQILAEAKRIQAEATERLEKEAEKVAVGLAEDTPDEIYHDFLEDQKSN